jgi:hypothetical protein
LCLLGLDEQAEPGEGELPQSRDVLGVGVERLLESVPLGARPWPDRAGKHGFACRGLRPEPTGGDRPGAFEDLDDEALAWPLGFAAGAVLASLADTLMPEAFEEARHDPRIAYFTSLGFLLSFLVSAA